MSVPTTEGPNPRHVAFSRFVKRATDQARATKGWEVRDIEAASGVGKSTIYRWISGDFELDPRGGDIERFCDALDIPPSVAFTILWPGKNSRRTVTEPLPMDDDFQLLLRKLRDPNVSEPEKYHIRETIQGLAARPVRPARSTTDRPATRRRTG